MTIQQPYSRVYAASPSYQWTNAAITDSNQLNVSWETYNSDSQKYLPFNFIRIVNNGEDDINFYPNQNTDFIILVPKGTIITIDERTVPALRSFAIKRTGTTNITANKIIVNCSRQAQSTDSIVSRLHERLLGGR